MKNNNKPPKNVDIAISVIDHLLAITDHDESVIEDVVNNLSDDEVDEAVNDVSLPVEELYGRINNLLTDHGCADSGGMQNLRSQPSFRLIEGGLDVDAQEVSLTHTESDAHITDGRDSFIREVNLRRLRMGENQQSSILCVLLDDGIETLFLGEEIANKISSSVRDRLDDLIRNNDIISQIGKNSFLILQDSDCDHDRAEAMARRIADIFKTVFYVEDKSNTSHEISLDAHVGIAMYSSGDDKPSETISENAELAAFQAQRDNLAIMHFEASIRLNVKRSMILKKEIKEAIQLDQLFVVYQPKYSLSHVTKGCHNNTRSLIGLEALVRWNHPRLNRTVYPAEFINFVEDNGLIGDVTRSVVDFVFKDYREWIDKGKNIVPVSINFSPNQFEDGDVHLLVAKALKNYGLSSNILDIEITEDVFMDLESNQRVNSCLRSLIEMGVSISIDDFGRGYSCLDKIFDIPISRIKIDQKFVSGLPQDRRSYHVVKAAIDLAKGMGLQATAEGVERPEQALTLRKLGCDEAQGFLFSKPISSEEAEKCLEVAGGRRLALASRVV